jgi:carboxyl-terminal processing protease
MKIRTSLQVALIVGASTVLVPFYGPAMLANAASPQDDLDKNIKSLATALSILEDNYADKVSSEKAIYQGAIPGMLRTLDPHSNFLDPVEYTDMQRKQRAQYFGIGMLISMDGPKVIAMEPFPGSPAWRADLRRGDTIVAVDGKDVTKKDSSAVADMLRGPRGSQVRVSVMREGATEPVTVTVTRSRMARAYAASRRRVSSTRPTNGASRRTARGRRPACADRKRNRSGPALSASMAPAASC